MSALLLPNEILSMSAQAARRLVEAGDGDCALLYLALLAGGDSEKARTALHWGEDHLSAAYSRLADLGLAEAGHAPKREKQPDAVETLPTYNRQDVANALRREPDFTSLYREVERLLGRPLSDTDLQTLYAIYDGMALPAEVILLLVNHKIHAIRRQKQNPGILPRMTQIRSEAACWKRLGLDTVAAAEAYLRSQERVDSREWAILSAVGVTERRPAVEQERGYISSWVELGLSDELISLAYQRTVYQKGQRNWPYMNKILLSWHQAGYRTVEQVKAGDRPAGGRPSARQGGKQPDYRPTAERVRKNGDWLDAFLEQQEKGE